MDTSENENQPSTLEDQATELELDTAKDAGEATDSQSSANASPPKPPTGGRIRTALSKINVYLLLFILIVLLACLVVFASLQRSRRENPTGPLDTQNLTQETIDQLEGSETSVGDPKQILNVESNAVFTGKVLIRDSLDVAGTIKVGGSLSLPGITVSGTSSFETIQAKDLAIAGNTSIEGQLNVQGSLTVAGGASFGGPISAPQISVNDLQLKGDLQLNRHIDAGGGTPGRNAGVALGGGGTTSVSGTDTAGTITINTGSNPPAGCFTTISFTQNYGGTPHVVVTPVGSGGANLNYYVNRTSSGFSLCTANPASAGRSFSFDYIVID